MHLLDSSGVLGALGFVFILALFLGLIWVMRKVTGAIGSKVNQVISPGAHRAGQQAAGTSYRFVSATVDAQEILARIYQSLAYPASETPVHTTTCAVRKFRDADGDIEIRYGKKLGGDLWRCVVLAIGEAVDYIVPEVTRVDSGCGTGRSSRGNEWSPLRESNPRPLAYKASALAAELRRRGAYCAKRYPFWGTQAPEAATNSCPWPLTEI